MTYKIYYIPKDEANCCKDYTMFDIEYYEIPSGKDGEWFSDLLNLPVVTGIACFLRDNLNDKDFNFEEFVKDAEDISWLRGLLHECYDNKPKTSTEAEHFHYHVFRPVLEEKIKAFAKKYGLFIDVD